MSFSYEAKAELCRLPTDKPCCALAELYGALLLGQIFSEREIKVVTSHALFTARLNTLLSRLFGFEFDISHTHKGDLQKLTIHDLDKIKAVGQAFGLAWPLLAMHLNLSVLENECCGAALLRGAFLSGGSVGAPSQKYHLEIVTARHALARELTALLHEADFVPKITERAGKTVVYFKSSEAIEDFLTLIGAPMAALRLMEAKVEKDLRNQVNRKVNCETANLEKTARAAVAQTEAFAKLQASPRWETLPEELKQTALIRLEHPEDTLAELAGRLKPPVGRSGLNHRLRKIMEIAREGEAVDGV